MTFPGDAHVALATCWVVELLAADDAGSVGGDLAMA
jgi:hypothetical protein